MEILRLEVSQGLVSLRDPGPEVSSVSSDYGWGDIILFSIINSKIWRKKITRAGESGTGIGGKRTLGL